MSIRIRIPAMVTLAMFGAAGFSSATVPAMESVDDLRRELAAELKARHMPGLSIAIVHREGPEWVGGLGLADVAANRPVTADTLFRIGSTSKMFVSLAILELVSEGKLSLEDSVRKLAPEVWFDNPWEATDPIRVVNLLEHTTGWDDLHLCVYAQDKPNAPLRDALDFDRHSRRSRWRPGTRAAYNNSGPAVAAYIVEKATGERFEDYVQRRIFAPIGMKTATYFQPAALSTTNLYEDDGTSPHPYWNLLLRPSGSVNASANDMAAYLLFILNRGTVGSRRVLPAEALDRMEVHESTWAARDGLKYGYGLSNVFQLHDGFVYHGHGGSLAGGLTEVKYLPEYGVGYFFSTNSGNWDAYGRVDELLRAYITRHLPKPPSPPAAPLAKDVDSWAGWYEPDASRSELNRPFERLLGLVRLRFGDGGLRLSRVTGGDPVSYVPVTDHQFRKVSEKDASDPIPTLALLPPNAEGRFIYSGIGRTMRRVPAWYAMGEIGAVLFVLASMVSVLLYAPFWMLGGLMRRRHRPAERSLRAWPLFAVLSIAASVAVTILVEHGDAIARLGNVSAWSLALFSLTSLFGLASLASVVA